MYMNQTVYTDYLQVSQASKLTEGMKSIFRVITSYVNVMHDTAAHETCSRPQLVFTILVVTR